MDIAVADFNGDDVLDIVTAEKGAPNFLYLGLGKTDPTKLGDFSGVTPIPIALKDAPTWYESAYEGTDVATGATIGGSERLPGFPAEFPRVKLVVERLLEVAAVAVKLSQRLALK